MAKIAKIQRYLIQRRYIANLKENIETVKVNCVKDGTFAMLLESLLNAALEGEMDSHMDEKEHLSGNYRNGNNRKQVQTSLSEVTFHTFCDRDTRFEEEFIKKREHILVESMADCIISI